VKTSEYAAVAAAHSVDPDRWQAEFSAVLDRIAPRFARYEPLRHAGELMAGMVSGLDRKNCWTIAEHRGAITPDGLQHLLARASWGADDVRDDLRDYVVDAFGDPGAILVVDLYRSRNYAEAQLGWGLKSRWRLVDLIRWTEVSA
jgi:SRSO17 transposase